MENILFLGGAGFIGSNLIRVFQQSSKYKVYVFEPECANIGRIAEFKEKINIIRGSIANTELLKLVINKHDINIIVHLVSTLIPGSTYDNFKHEFENVVFPTTRLMEYCAERNVKFVYFSSGGTVYGNSITGDKFKETDVLSPISYYGLTKQIIENNVLFENRRGGMKYLIVRPSNPYGKGQSLSGNQGLIAVAIGKILKNQPIEIWGDGTSVRDYIYIYDLVEAFFQLVDNSVENEIVNVGCGKGYSINNIIECLKNISEIPFDVIYKQGRSVDVNSMVLDTTKLNSLVDLTPKDLISGVSEFYDYAKRTF